MQPIKTLLLVPFAVMALASCGGGGKLEYSEAKARAASYATSISQNKASTVVVDGTINSLEIKGDAMYWYYGSEGGGDDDNQMVKKGTLGAEFNPLSLLAMIPNFDLKDAEIKVDSQKLAEMTIPGALTAISEFKGDADTWVFANLPRFPVNETLIKLINGVKKVEQPDDDKPWFDNLTEEAWTKATVEFFDKSGGIDIHAYIPHVGEFAKEVYERTDPSTPSKIVVDDYNFPLELRLGTNNIGYVDSFAVKFKTPKNIKINSDGKDNIEDILYYSFDASFDIDFALNFHQEYSKQISLKYQMTTYEYDNETETFNKKGPSKDPTTDLNTFKDYFKVEWYYEEEDEDNYDDPVFRKDYWHSKEYEGRNIAYENEPYDVYLVPNYEVKDDSVNEKYTILCYDQLLPSEYSGNRLKESLNSVSCNGRLISERVGFESYDAKDRYDAADGTHTYEFKYNEKTYNIYDACNLFINSTMLQDSRGEYVIDVAIVPAPSNNK